MTATLAAQRAAGPYSGATRSAHREAPGDVVVAAGSAAARSCFGMPAHALDDLTELTDQLDGDWVLPCEFIAHEGDAQARWILFPSCCSVDGRAYLLGCDACKARKISQARGIICQECNTEYLPAARAWRRIEPINR